MDLIHAVLAKDLSRVQDILTTDIDVNFSDTQNNTVLHYAANTSMEIVKLLIHNGAKVNKTNDRGNTPLFHAAYCNNINIINTLIEYGADVNIQNIDGDTCLIYATDYDEIDVIKELIRFGADLDIKNKKNHTALSRAVCNGNQDIVKLLLDSGADRDYVLIREMLPKIPYKNIQELFNTSSSLGRLTKSARSRK